MLYPLSSFITCLFYTYVKNSTMWVLGNVCCTPAVLVAYHYGEIHSLLNRFHRISVLLTAFSPNFSFVTHYCTLWLPNIYRNSQSFSCYVTIWWIISNQLISISSITYTSSPAREGLITNACLPSGFADHSATKLRKLMRKQQFNWWDHCPFHNTSQISGLTEINHFLFLSCIFYWIHDKTWRNVVGISLLLTYLIQWCINMPL